MNPAPLPIMKIRCHITFGLLLLPALFAPASAFGERLYKWIDANGQVHYSSQLPPEAAKQRREILDKQGRTLKVYRAPPTGEKTAACRKTRHPRPQPAGHLFKQEGHVRGTRQQDCSD
jgi:hypothetical protein